jgi:hyperosmotically inducible protein
MDRNLALWVRPAPWLLCAAVALSLAGCTNKEAEAPSGPPGGPPAGVSPTGGPPGAPPGAAPTAAKPPGAAGPDAVVNSKVKNALITSKVDVSHVAVESKDGAVTLSGSVPTQGQKALAGKAAKKVTGVTTITDKLTVGAKK